MKNIYLKLVTMLLVTGVLFSCTGTLGIAADETEPYQLIGISNGDKIMLNENFGKTVNIVDALSADTLTIYRKTTTTNGTPSAVEGVPVTKPNAEATGIHHVEYYLDNVLVATDNEAPYVQTLPIENVGAGTVTAKIYDSETNVIQTITKAFTGVYSEEAACWEEDFEGTFSKIGETSFDSLPIPTSITHNVTTVTDAEQAVITHPVNGTKGLKFVPGNGLSNGFHVGLMPASLSGTTWTNGIDWTANTGRIFLEFDYSVDPWLGSSFNLKLNEGFKEAKATNSTEYGVIVLPKAFLSKNPATGIMNRVGVDISWDNTSRSLSYILYINGQECYRDTTILAYRETVDPAKLMVGLSCPNGSSTVSCYIDNIRVAAYDTTGNLAVSGDRQWQKTFEKVKGAVTATTVIGNTSGADQAMDIFYAVYNSDGSLKSVTKDDFTLTAGTVRKNQMTINSLPGETVKVFAWKDGLQPITYLGEAAAE